CLPVDGSTAVTVPSSAPTIARPAATATPVWLTSVRGTVQSRCWVDAFIATSVEVVVVADGDAIAPVGVEDASLPGDAVAGAVAVGDGVGEFVADTDSSPPPSTNNTVPPTTAAGDDGPSDRGALHATWPSVTSTASTDSRPTTIASPFATTGAGIPDA